MYRGSNENGALGPKGVVWILVLGQLKYLSLHPNGKDAFSISRGCEYLQETGG
jgi:hypothetical protein